MFSLAAGCVARMRKRATSAQGETNPDSKGPNGKHFKQSGSVEEFQISPVVISVDSPERALGTLPTLEGDAQGASLEACTSLEDGASAGEPPLDDEVAKEALPAEEASGPPPRAKQPSLALSGA